MILNRAGIATNSSLLERKVTLTRQGAPLLYAHDAASFTGRLKGLKGVPPLGPTDALIIRPCRAIHTYGMRQPIDVIFMNRQGVILKLNTVKPKSMMFCWRAQVAVEMAHGTASRLGLKVGQQFKTSEGQW